MRELKITLDPENQLSRKGAFTFLLILTTARDIFINRGYSNFSLQKVAEISGLARGNVTYYFANREALLRALLTSIIRGYIDDFDVIMKEDSPAEEKFIRVISLIISDLGTRETSLFFPELWALAGHNDVAANAMDELYIHARKCLVELIRQINPQLKKAEHETLALFISAAMEGQTPFIGYNRKYAHKRKNIEKISTYAFLKIVKEIKSESINFAERLES